MVLTTLAAEVAHRLLRESPGVSAGLSKAPEVAVASRAMQQVIEVNAADEPPPPSLGSHNAELYPELDSQAIPEDMRGQIRDVIEAGRVEREREGERERERERGG